MSLERTSGVGMFRASSLVRLQRLGATVREWHHSAALSCLLCRLVGKLNNSCIHICVGQYSENIKNKIKVQSYVARRPQWRIYYHCLWGQLLLLLLLKEVGSARLGKSDQFPVSPKTPAPQYQPIDRKKRKGKIVESYSRDKPD